MSYLGEKKRHIYMKGNDKFEVKFLEYFNSKYGNIASKASHLDDCVNHIDIYVAVPDTDRQITDDIKQPKKYVQSSDFQDEHEDPVFWFEIININGNKGSLLGKQDFFIQFVPGCKKAYWLPLKNLLKYFKTKNINLNFKGTASNIRPKKDYELYTRKGNKDVIFRTHLSDLMDHVPGIREMQIPSEVADELNEIVKESRSEQEVMK